MKNHNYFSNTYRRGRENTNNGKTLELHCIGREGDRDHISRVRMYFRDFIVRNPEFYNYL
jgi:hypothetical protein